MNQSLDQEYLSRPLVEDVTYEIEPARLYIQCSHTSYVGAFLEERYQKNQLLGMYRRVLRAAKVKGIRISYGQHFSKTIKERWAEYETACGEQEDLFHQLIEQAKRVQSRGIHYGTVDDMELSLLRKLEAKFYSYTHGSSVISLLDSIGCRLAKLDRELSQPSSHYTMIYL